MKNFAYRNNEFIQPISPCKSWRPCSNNNSFNKNDDRFGGFLLPFITGAVVSAPFWFVAGNNKAQYQNQQYPVYYPYQTYPQSSPMYYPYPPYPYR